ncbi:restriction endonuclease subunit S [Fusobacterium necrophorum]|uniref:restriction endonuclease subunit S n=1 Tax=Fusobacterium necrophorum TaxID=859 RepID=UPI0010101AFB|nr:restriction endonuclease subunit S [Fusobacterium necrophorum]RXZ28642.1 restriction endonuclease subunit S [Fusobacterium necrophorum]
MKLTRYKLGDLIEQSDERNKDESFSLEDVKGISIQKQFIETKADMQNVSLKPYKVVRKNYFSYVTVTSRNGEKITLALNNTDKTYIVSSSYIVFYIKRFDLISPDYLFLYFNRPEFDRYSRFNSWGSARETFDWNEICDIEVDLPPLEIQEKYVAIYNAMVKNQQSYEKGLEDLKLVCDAYIENLRRIIPSEEIGEYIEEVNERNIDSYNSNILGVESSHSFCKTKANTIGLNLSNYKVVSKMDFTYNPSRINLGSIALLKDNKCIVSPMYIVFRVMNIKKIIPEFLMIWFSRDEFKRSTLFFATGSVRDTFDFNLMKEVKIPIPDIKVQQSIADIYKVYKKRKEINEKLKTQIKDICKILIRGSIEEAKR